MSAPDAPCVFCEIVADRAPARIVRRWADAVAFEPLDPVTEGHVLVVPRQHCSDVREQPQLAALAAERAASLVSGSLEDVNLITSAGPAASQTVRHLHWHVVPRRDGDGLRLPWTRVWGDPVTDELCAARDALAGIDHAGTSLLDRDTVLGELRTRIDGRVFPAGGTP